MTPPLLYSPGITSYQMTHILLSIVLKWSSHNESVSLWTYLTEIILMNGVFFLAKDAKLLVFLNLTFPSWFTAHSRSKNIWKLLTKSVSELKNTLNSLLSTVLLYICGHPSNSCCTCLTFHVWLVLILS